MTDKRHLVQQDPGTGLVMPNQNFEQGGQGRGRLQLEFAFALSLLRPSWDPPALLLDGFWAVALNFAVGIQIKI